MNRSAKGGKSVKRFERSNGVDTALYKNYLYLYIYQKSGWSNVTTGGALCLEQDCKCTVVWTRCMSCRHGTCQPSAERLCMYSGLAWVLTVRMEYMHHSLPIWYRLCKAKGHLPQYVNVIRRVNLRPKTTQPQKNLYKRFFDGFW